jgi:hypothetical protein
MAEYLPKFKPGDSVTGVASGTITGGKLVYVSGDGTIAQAGAAANIPVGVASRDAVSGDRVGYFARGQVHRLTASGAITAGNVVEAAAAGAVAAHTVGTNDARVFGIALTTAADGAAVEIMEL